MLSSEQPEYWDTQTNPNTFNTGLQQPTKNHSPGLVQNWGKRPEAAAAAVHYMAVVC